MEVLIKNIMIDHTPIQTVKIELTTFDGQLYHQSNILTGAIANVNTIVHDGRHFAFSRMHIDQFWTTIHFSEAEPPVDLDVILGITKS